MSRVGFGLGAIVSRVIDFLCWEAAVRVGLRMMGSIMACGAPPASLV